MYLLCIQMETPSSESGSQGKKSTNQDEGVGVCIITISYRSGIYISSDKYNTQWVQISRVVHANEVFQRQFGF